MPAETTDTVTIPPEVRPSINRMADRFKEAQTLGRVPKPGEKAAAEKPAAQPPPAEAAKATTPEPPKPAETTPAEKPAVPEFKAPVAEKPAAQPEKPAQVQPDTKTKIPSEQFKILEKSRDEFRDKFESTQKRVLELEAKLTSQTPIISPEELEAIKKERDSYKGIAEQVALEHTPEFKRAFTDKIKDLKAEVKDAVGAEQADKIAKILKMPAEQRDEQIEALAEELSSFKQAKLSRLITELQRTERERDNELAKSSENIGKLEEYRTEREQQEKTKDRKQLESAFDAELQRVAVLPEFQIIDGNDEHNTVARTNRERAKSFLNSTSAADRARIAFWAAKGVASVESDAMKDALITKLQTQLQEVQGASPSLGGKGGDPTQPNKPMGFIERFKKAQQEGIPQE